MAIGIKITIGTSDDVEALFWVDNEGEPCGSTSAQAKGPFPKSFKEGDRYERYTPIIEPIGYFFEGIGE